MIEKAFQALMLDMLCYQNEGFGYASEGAATMVQLTINEYQQEKVYAITTEKNVRSCKLLEKLGFAFMKPTYLPNSDQELKLYMKEK